MYEAFIDLGRGHTYRETSDLANTGQTMPSISGVRPGQHN